jgi:hypothetical protein
MRRKVYTVRRQRPLDIVCMRKNRRIKFRIITLCIVRMRQYYSPYQKHIELKSMQYDKNNNVDYISEVRPSGFL